MKLLNLTPLVLASIKAATTVNIDYNVQNGALELFSYFFESPVLGVMILNHGCWCSKLNPQADHSSLGGPTTVDHIDEICKQWQRARRCSKLTGNSCESMNMIGNDYQVKYDSGASDAVCPDSNECLSLACQIDLFYINLILESSVNFVPETNPICELSVSGGSVSFCEAFETTELPTVPSTVAVTTMPATLLMDSPIAVLCRQIPMDLVFVVDGSGSVGVDNFNKQILFMKQVTSLMTISPSDTRVSLIQYSSASQLEFGYIDNNAALQTAFDGVQFLQGGTNTGAAIQDAYNMVIQPTSRSDIRAAMVVLTDGFSFDNVAVPSDEMRAHGIEMFSVGYFGANVGQLESIANSPAEDFMYKKATVDDLLEITEELVQVICSLPAGYQGQ